MSRGSSRTERALVCDEGRLGAFVGNPSRVVFDFWIGIRRVRLGRLNVGFARLRAALLRNRRDVLIVVRRFLFFFEEEYGGRGLKGIFPARRVLARFVGFELSEFRFDGRVGVF